MNMPGRLKGLLVVVTAATAAATVTFWSGLPPGATALRCALSALFAILFGWLAFWCGVSVIGAAILVHTRAHRTAENENPKPKGTPGLPRTAILMPIHNEDVDSVFSRLAVMMDAVEASGHGATFDFFVLSDTSDPDTWLREELCWATLRERRRGGGPELFYRRRPRKFRKKSGNISDFCERWGGRYRYAIVLDADSLMEADVLVELVLRMEAAPRLGILQTPSIPVLRSSLHARLQQFAASVYGPPLFAGLSYCFSGHSTFWGHNAILRLDAFARHCGLPALPGAPPFGGPILSHDFVEAALMRRGGYEVRLAWDLWEGSYEQCPVSLSGTAVRDRRWCQGNLQHLRLMLSPSFSPTSKLHFAIGILFYTSSALLTAFVGLFLVSTAVADGASAGGARGVGPAVLLGVTLGLLFVPKLLPVLLLNADSVRSRAHGGRLRVTASAVVESVVGVLVAPVRIVTHLMCIGSILGGLSVDWGASDRDESRSPLRDAVRAHGTQALLGLLVFALAAEAGATPLLLLAPLWVGLLLAVPLGAALASTSAGRLLHRMGLLRCPSEIAPSPLLASFQTTHRASSAGGPDETFQDRFGRVVQDPWLNTLHVSLLRAIGGHRRPRRVLEPLVGKARRDGLAALTRPEATAVLSDAWAMRRLHECACAPAASLGPVAGIPTQIVA